MAQGFSPILQREFLFLKIASGFRPIGLILSAYRRNGGYVTGYFGWPRSAPGIFVRQSLAEFGIVGFLGASNLDLFPSKPHHCEYGCARPTIQRDRAAPCSASLRFKKQLLLLPAAA